MTEKKQLDELNEIAALLKAMANPVRLAILEELCQGAKCVQDVQEIVDISQPNLSQHLANLKKGNLINSYSSGPLRCYYLLNPSLVKNLLKELKKERRITVRPRQSVIREVNRNRIKQVKKTT
ncbi:MAG: ArsR family transcriptional regulator [Candidatus Omnitrophota bacterium]|jgi:ArsR family transcriptional regulator|nr:MAG: ArsR family transcriptional regulator [Candidatus Omnitrophota bacterium]